MTLKQIFEHIQTDILLECSQEDDTEWLCDPENHAIQIMRADRGGRTIWTIQTTMKADNFHYGTSYTFSYNTTDDPYNEGRYLGQVFDSILKSMNAFCTNTISIRIVGLIADAAPKTGFMLNSTELHDRHESAAKTQSGQKGGTGPQ